jgi:hypothetical protein
LVDSALSQCQIPCRLALVVNSSRSWMAITVLSFWLVLMLISPSDQPIAIVTALYIM